MTMLALAPAPALLRNRSTVQLPALIAAAVSSAALACAPAVAQSAHDECAGMASAAEEIACLREALERSRRAPGEATSNAERPADDPIEPQAALPPMDARPAAVEASPQRELGAEQTAAREVDRRDRRREAESIEARIATAMAGPRGMLTFQLDNGQLWQQVDRTAVPVRMVKNKQYAVEITRSGFGGYRLRFADSGKTVAVKRLQ